MGEGYKRTVQSQVDGSSPVEKCERALQVLSRNLLMIKSSETKILL